MLHNSSDPTAAMTRNTGFSSAAVVVKARTSATAGRTPPVSTSDSGGKVTAATHAKDVRTTALFSSQLKTDALPATRALASTLLPADRLRNSLAAPWRCNGAQGCWTTYGSTSRLRGLRVWGSSLSWALMGPGIVLSLKVSKEQALREGSADG